MKIFVLVTDETKAVAHHSEYDILYTLKATEEEIARIEDEDLEDSEQDYILYTTQVLALSNNLLDQGWTVAIDPRDAPANTKGETIHGIFYGMPLRNGEMLKRTDDIRKLFLLGEFDGDS